MSRITVTVEDDLIAEAQQTFGTSSKSEAVRVALEEALRLRRLARARDHRGEIDLDLDRKTLSSLREQG